MANVGTFSDGRDEASPAIDARAALTSLGDDVTIDDTPGFPLLFAHRKGPMTAGLVFRVGWADERLSRAGITHLVEHLALHGQFDSDIHVNGSTGAMTTRFHVQGSPRQVVEFVNGVTSALADGLPWGRIEHEKNILRIEESGRSWGTVARQRVERHGAQGHGLLGYGAAGIDAVTAEDLQEWLGRFFTRGNAVGWLTGDHLPAGFEVKLPAGSRRAGPALTSILEATPAVFQGPNGAVMVDAIVPRSPAASVFARLTSRLLTRSLRHEAGLSYMSYCEGESIDPDTVRLTIVADAVHDTEAEVLARIFAVLESVRSGVIAEADLDVAMSIGGAGSEHHDFAALLPDLAAELVLGTPIRHPADLDRRHRAVRVDDLRAVAEQFLASALAQTPSGTPPVEGFHRVASSSEEAVLGRPYPRLDVPESALYIASDGISAREHGRIVTVYFDDCVLLERWPDGARRLTGADGFQLIVEPTLHADLVDETIAGIDASVDAEAHVDRPARTPENIPRPPEREVPAETTTRGPLPARRVPGFAIAASVVLLLFLLGVVLTFNDALHIDTPYNDGSVASGTTIVGGMITCAVLAALSTALFLTEYMRARRRRSRA